MRSGPSLYEKLPILQWVSQVPFCPRKCPSPASLHAERGKLRQALKCGIGTEWNKKKGTDAFNRLRPVRGPRCPLGLGRPSHLDWALGQGALPAVPDRHPGIKPSVASSAAVAPAAGIQLTVKGNVSIPRRRVRIHPGQCQPASGWSSKWKP